MKIASTLSSSIVTASIAGLFSFSIAAGAATEIAKINGKIITLEELDQKYQQSLHFYQGKIPSKKELLDDLIKKEIAVQEAKKEGLDRDPGVIEAINTVLFNALVQHKLAKEFDAITVSDSEGQSFYTKNPEVRTSHIFIAAPIGISASDDKKAKERIQKIYDEHIRPGKEDFAEVAQRFSEGNAATMGGDIDWKMRDTIDPVYYAAAIALRRPGAISGIVRSPLGYHIIKLTGIKTWDEVDRPSVKRLLILDRQKEAFEKYMNQLKSHAQVTVHSNLIKE